MSISRRLLLSLPALLAMPAIARADAALDAAMAERSIGSPDAKVVATEWFSLGCPHCAHFELAFLPQIRKDLIETGKLRIIFRDFPLDDLSVTAAMVARSLPADRYLPFIEALFASQNRWAYAQNIDNVAEIGKMAALAGLSNDSFKAVVANGALRKAIVSGRDEAIDTYKVDSTPSFILNGPKAKNRKEVGAQTPDALARVVSELGG